MKANFNNQGAEGCKLFVGGLTWNTTKDMLYEEFSKFGEIVDWIVMTDRETGASRGFGFITFKDAATADSALRAGPFKIDGKNVGGVGMRGGGGGGGGGGGMMNHGMMNNSLGGGGGGMMGGRMKNENCKVFVGGLPNGLGEEDIKQFFSRYGPVKDFKLYFDEIKQKPKGYGFLTFEFEESANQVLQEHFIQLNGKQIEIKPQANNAKQQMLYGQQQQQQPSYQQYPNAGGPNQWGGPQQQWNAPVTAGGPVAGQWAGGYPAPGGPAALANQAWGYPSNPAEGGAPTPYGGGYYGGYYDQAAATAMMPPNANGAPVDPLAVGGPGGYDELAYQQQAAAYAQQQQQMPPQDPSQAPPNMGYYRGSSHGSSSNSSKAPSLSSMQSGSTSGVSKSSNSDISSVSHQNHHMGRYNDRNGGGGGGGGRGGGSRHNMSGGSNGSDRGSGGYQRGGGKGGPGSMGSLTSDASSAYSSRGGGGGGGGGHQSRQSSSSYHPYRR